MTMTTPVTPIKNPYKFTLANMNNAATIAINTAILIINANMPKPFGYEFDDERVDEKPYRHEICGKQNPPRSRSNRELS